MINSDAKEKLSEYKYLMNLNSIEPSVRKQDDRNYFFLKVRSSTRQRCFEVFGWPGGDITYYLSRT